MKVHETPCFFMGWESRVGGGRSNREMGMEVKTNLGLHLIMMMNSLSRLEGTSSHSKGLLSLISMLLLVF